ncbi:unnamed protein product [Durusdinium trenchii]|uniref:Choline transporter-like protein n=1 Tax=Durusdinium trenchii TaxID=1381693 RepID=A0ABP0QZE4_9DINO
MFLLAILVFCAVVILGSWKPERHDFVRLTDGRGTQCGVYDEIGKDYWYLCGADSWRTLPSEFRDMENDTFLPTCVHDCSNAHKHDHCANQWELLEVTTYSARVVGPLCWPVNATFAAHLRFVLQTRHYKSIDMFLSVYFAWPPLAVAALLSVAFSHMWTRILRDHAHCLAWIGMYLLVTLPLMNLAYCWLRYGAVDRLYAIGALLVAACFGCLACRNEPHLDRATYCLHAACHCVTDMPLLEIGPAIVTTLKICILLAAIWFIRFTPTTLHFEIRTGTLQFLHYGDTARQVGDVSVAVLYCLFWLWCWNVINSFWELSCVALTVLWYVHKGKHDEPPGLLAGLKCMAVLLRFHGGSIAFAAVCIGLVRPFRFVLGTLTAVTRMPQNPFSWMEMSCCPCLVSLYKLFDRFSANAFVDLVLHGTALRKAMEAAAVTMETCQTTANSLNGTTFVFQVICLCLTWWFGFMISWIAVTQIPEYNDPIHFGYVPYVWYWCVVSGFIASICSYSHVMVFDIGSDTILYLQTLREMNEELADRELRRLSGGVAGVATNIYEMFRSIAGSALGCAYPV